jgi:hypothetical protein
MYLKSSSEKVPESVQMIGVKQNFYNNTEMSNDISFSMNMIFIST